MRRAWALAAASLLLAAGPLRAQVRLEKVEWQLASKASGRSARYETVSELKLSAGGSGRLRAKLTIKNTAQKAVEGILLKYSLSARLLQTAQSQGGVWAVPFSVEERRVPKLGPGESREILLQPSLLSAHLARISREGFRPDELKLLLMIEPRPGQEGPLEALESQLSVTP